MAAKLELVPAFAAQEQMLCFGLFCWKVAASPDSIATLQTKGHATLPFHCFDFPQFAAKSIFARLLHSCIDFESERETLQTAP